jgi:hypothetical protein
MESEKITHSDEFGYIYRYQIAQPIADAHGGGRPVRSILVVWSTDCKEYRIASYPTFKLPDVTSK